MRLLALPFVLFFAIFASAAERRTTLDEAAQDYVRLVLEIGAHESWLGSAENHPGSHVHRGKRSC